MFDTKIKILRVLAVTGRELRGLEIVDAEPSIGLGGLYLHLYELEQAGSVSSRKEEPHEMARPGAVPPRRLYRITEGGRRQLASAEGGSFEPNAALRVAERRRLTA